MFILSKIVGALLNPVLWIVLLLLWAFFSKKTETRKKKIGLALIFTLFFSNPLIIQNLIVSYQPKVKPMQDSEQYAAGILLGGLVSYDETERQPYFNISSDRFIQTVRLYKLGHIKKIIVSGGNAIFANDSFREADFLRKNLMDLGIPEADILIERNSRNTIENSRFVKQVADSASLNGTFVLITSAFHMPRAVLTFEKAGIKVRPYPCAYLVMPSDRTFKWRSLVPAAWAIENWQIYLREMAGRAALKFR